MFSAVGIVDVVVPKSFPATDPARVKSLSESIDKHGLLHPITIVGKNKHLIAGRHRLEAVAMQGGTIIECKTLTCSELEAELIGIDENLERKKLPALLEDQQLKRRKVIWEELYPETRRGGTPGAGKGKGSRPRKSDKMSFIRDTAKMKGTSGRSIERRVESAQKIPADVVETLQDHPINKSRKQISELAALPVDQQRVVANALASGEVKTVAEAIAPVCPNCGGREFDEDGDCIGCHEPEVVKAEELTGKERTKAIKAAVTANGVLIRRLDDLQIDWKPLTLQAIRDTLRAM